MAVHGVSLAEKDRYILREDPAHPDNLETAFATRTHKQELSDEQKSEIRRKVEDEAGQPTVFVLGNLLGEDRTFLGDMGQGMEQTPQGTFRMTTKNTAKMFEVVRRGLRGWENFTDENGKKLPFETEPGQGERGQPRQFVSEASMAYMTNDIIRELSARILEVNGVTTNVEKKLHTALQQGQDPHSAVSTALDAAQEIKSSVDAEPQPENGGGN